MQSTCLLYYILPFSNTLYIYLISQIHSQQLKAADGILHCLWVFRNNKHSLERTTSVLCTVLLDYIHGFIIYLISQILIFNSQQLKAADGILHCLGFSVIINIALNNFSIMHGFTWLYPWFYGYNIWSLDVVKRLIQYDLRKPLLL